LSVINAFTIDTPIGAESALRVARATARRRRVSGSEPRPYTGEQVRAMHALVGLDVFEEVTRDEAGHPPTLFVARARRTHNDT
jgi:hypothetical protein